MKLIFDCDNTLGLQDRDIDDALALLFLLGAGAEPIAITTSHGNGDSKKVYQATGHLLEELHRQDIPLYPGDQDPIQISEAALQLSVGASVHKDKLHILATGALTNLYSALRLDRDFLDNTGKIVVMGGITSPLLIGEGNHQKEMKELNFSVDPYAAQKILAEAKDLSILTGNNCLAAQFTKEELLETFGPGPLMDKIAYWLDYYQRNYNISGFYNWDATAAAYLLYPQLFEAHYERYSVNPRLLAEGRLKKSDGGVLLNLPTIKDVPTFKKVVLENIQKGLSGSFLPQD